jgi:NAD(P)-dependent dehydrogenase (short-subunit alcohol dehydrogenase family)
MLRAGLERRPEEGGVDEGLRMLAAKTPRGRIGSPEEIAQTILFLASTRSANITGQAIVDDGGATARLSTE